jgi:hypothetical protein
VIKLLRNENFEKERHNHIVATKFTQILDITKEGMATFEEEVNDS